MRKASLFFVSLLTFSLCSCAPNLPKQPDSSVPLDEPVSPSVVESEPDKQPLTFADLDLSDFGIDQDRETYFSKEQYLDWDFVTGGPSSSTRISMKTVPGANGAMVNTFDLETNLPIVENGALSYEKVPLCSFDQLFDEYWPCSRYLMYLKSGNTLYRVFVPDGPDAQLEEIFSSEEKYYFRPVTNFVTVISYQNPAFQEAMDLYGYEGMPADHPAQYLHYLLDCRDGSLTEFHLSSINYPENAIIDTIPAEELRPLE